MATNGLVEAAHNADKGRHVRLPALPFLLAMGSLTLDYARA